MIQEEKAKAYDEALKDMRVIYPNLKGDTKLAVEHAFPELAESEDERIRKQLIDVIEYFRSRGIDQQLCEKFIAYLEKQKELDKMIVVSPEVWDKAISDAFENGKKEGVKQKEPHFTKRNALFDKCVENCDPTVMKKVSDEVDEMLEKEQKPVEWSEEERKILDSIIDDYEKASKSFCGYDGKILVLKAIRDGNLPKPAWSEEDDNHLHSIYHYLRILKDNSDNDSVKKNIEECINWFSKRYQILLASQLKQEWSEEDEQYLLVCKNALSKYQLSDGWDAYIISTWLKKRLKSLRPSWKPSEEQMETLVWCKPLFCDPKSKKILESLINDLKKLM